MAVRISPAVRRSCLAFAVVVVATCPVELAAQQNVASLDGTVRDGLAGRPLAGARVELVPAAARESAGYVAEADASGRFHLDSVAPGRYMLGFAHPRLDSLGLVLAPRLVEVTRASANLRADLALPTARELGQVLCGIQRDGAGTLFGRVLDADRGAPVTAGTVLIRWGEIQVDSTGIQRVLRGVRAQVGAGGRFAACGVPTGVAVLVQARALTSLSSGAVVAALGSDSTGKASITESASDGIEITLDPADPARYRDIFVPSSSLLSDAVRDSLEVSGGAGSHAIASRLSGRVFRPDGSPLAGARVRVRGGQSRDREALSDADGFYMLDGVPSGTQSVEVVAIGYAPVRAALDLRPASPATFDVRLTKNVVVLNPVAVYSAPARASSEFARRQREGFGVFLTASEFSRRTSMFFANALVGVGGLRIVGVTDDNVPVLGGRFNCQPAVFLDGFRLPEGSAGLDRWVRVSEVGGVEVYGDGISAPPQYSNSGGSGDFARDVSGMNASPGANSRTGSGGCGVLLVWTKQAIW